MTGICSIEGCGREGRVINGVCPMHDARMRAWGHYGSASPLRDRNRRCSVDGCDRKHSTAGFCETHHRRVVAHGDPLAHVPITTVRRRLTSQGCSVDGCNAQHWARGYCRKHYKRWRANGTPHLTAFRERFWRQVVRGGPDDCWPWTGATARGYGHGHHERQHFYAHRVSWEWANGQELDSRTVVRHLCDNPPCVNPAHLEIGTQADNVADMITRGRAYWQRGQTA